MCPVKIQHIPTPLTATTTRSFPTSPLLLSFLHRVQEIVKFHCEIISHGGIILKHHEAIEFPSFFLLLLEEVSGQVDVRQHVSHVSHRVETFPPPPARLWSRRDVLPAPRETHEVARGHVPPVVRGPHHARKPLASQLVAQGPCPHAPLLNPLSRYHTSNTPPDVTAAAAAAAASAAALLHVNPIVDFVHLNLVLILLLERQLQWQWQLRLVFLLRN
mmetsp:Transcript_14400/g.27808  ORF Transcript_14400/g.27808 Transcript_14400/m.27808 type:complete len:217 (-) Transcript_14400:479-1129(-)